MAQFTNQATLTFNGNTRTSNIVTGELQTVLSATKTAVVDTYVYDDKVTYVLTLVNSSSTAFTGLTITDNLGEYTFGLLTLVPLTYIANSIQYYTNGTLQADPAVAAGPPLVISGITVPANGNATIIYEVETNQYAPLDITDSIINEVVVSGEGLSVDVEATETITPEEAPDLTITKTMDPAIVTENDQITYTFIIQNFGNTAAVVGDNVSITDTFNPIINPITVTFNGAAWADPANYSYSSTTGLFTTVAGQIVVDAATFVQDPVSGAWLVNPGVSYLVVTGTL